ncbi:hypothetical protein CCL22_21505 [Pseudomonas syringae]|nr:hypothetical protein CCL22_21505 [Pseudomonas syringae]
MRDWRSTSINRGGPTTFMVGLLRIMQRLCQLAPAALQARIGNACKAAQRLRRRLAHDFSCLALVRTKEAAL